MRCNSAKNDAPRRRRAESTSRAEALNPRSAAASSGRGCIQAQSSRRKKVMGATEVGTMRRRHRRARVGHDGSS